MRTAIYARYSSDAQREASIEDQVRVCRARADREGWQVVKLFPDAAISGTNNQRPGYLALQAAVRAGEIDIVLSESLDRFSRDQEHIAAFFKLMEYCEIRLVTLSEGDIGQLHVGLKGTMGAIYLKDLADKTRRGIEGRIRQGRGSGRVAHGYQAVRSFLDNGEPDRGLRRIDSAEASVIRRIFRDYAAGHSPLVIARALNEEGIAGPSGGIWYDPTIRGRPKSGDGILRNPL